MVALPAGLLMSAGVFFIIYSSELFLVQSELNHIAKIDTDRLASVVARRLLFVQTLKALFEVSDDRVSMSDFYLFSNVSQTVIDPANQVMYALDSVAIVTYA